MIGLGQQGDLGGDSTWPSSKIIPKKYNDHQFPVENTHPCKFSRCKPYPYTSTSKQVYD